MSTLHNRAAEAAQRRELRRAIALSGMLHLVIGAAFYFAPPLMARSPELPGIITVDLVAMPAIAGAAASRPPPAPAPPEPIPATPTPPKPPPPPKREVVIPETPRREAKPKPKPKAPPKPPEDDPPPPRDDEVEYDDLLAELRAERGEAPPAEVARAETQPAAPSTPSAGGGGTVQVSPEVARWLRQADRHVKRFWVVPLGLQDAPLVVTLDVRLDASGALLGEPRITKRSGNPWFDEGAVRAVEKAAPLPAPPEAGTWPFVFRPEDLD